MKRLLLSTAFLLASYAGMSQERFSNTYNTQKTKQDDRLENYFRQFDTERIVALTPDTLIDYSNYAKPGIVHFHLFEEENIFMENDNIIFSHSHIHNAQAILESSKYEKEKKRAHKARMQQLFIEKEDILNNRLYSELPSENDIAAMIFRETVALIENKNISHQLTIKRKNSMSSYHYGLTEKAKDVFRLPQGNLKQEAFGQFLNSLYQDRVEKYMQKHCQLTTKAIYPKNLFCKEPNVNELIQIINETEYFYLYEAK